MTIVTHLVWSTINAVWQSGLLACLAWIALRIAGRVPAAARYSVWTAVLIAAAVLPFVNLATPAGTIAKPAAHAAISAAVTQSVTLPSAVTLLPVRAAAHAGTASHTSGLVIAPGNGQALSVASDDTTHVSPIASRAPLAAPLWLRASEARFAALAARSALAIAALWLLFSAALLARLGCGLFVLARIKRALRNVESPSITQTLATCARRVTVGSSREIDTPCVIGFVKPVIAVPAELIGALDSENLSRVLSHELAHVRRFDDWANLLQRALQAFFWVNPVVHFACRRLDIDREIACDDMVAAAHRDRLAYARCLADIARKTGFAAHVAPAAGFFPDRRQIVVRIEQLLDRNHHGSARVGLVPAAAAAAMLVAVIALARFQVPALGAPVPVPAPAPALTAEPACLCPNASASALPQPQPQPVPKAALHAVKPARPKIPSVHVVHAASHSTIVIKSLNGKPIIVRAVAPGTFIDVDKMALDSEKQAVELLSKARLTSTLSLAQMSALRAQTLAQMAARLKVQGPALSGLGLKIKEDEAFTLRSAPAVWVVSDQRDQHQTDDFLDALQAAGYTHLSVDQLIEIRNSGVTADYLHALKQYGVTPMPVENLVQLCNAGVSADYLAGMSKLGYARLGVGDLVSLANAGVSVDYVRSLSSAGYSGLAPRDLIRLANAGVTASMIKSLQAHGIGSNGRLSVDDLIKLANAGL